MISLPNHINQIIYTTFGSNPEEISIVTGGLSGAKLYQLKIDGKNILLRIANLELYSESASESARAAESLASQLNIAPTIYYTNAKLGLIMMEYVLQQPYDLSQLSVLDTFAIMVQRLHSIKSYQNSIMMSIGDYVKTIEVIINEIQLQQKMPNVVKQLQAQIAQIVPKLQKSLTYTMVHNDINPGNLLFNGQQFFLIDWDRVCLSDPYLDLASIINFFLFDSRLSDYFLKVYFGKSPDENESAKLFLMRQISYYFYGMRFLKFASIASATPIAQIDISDIDNLQSLYIQIRSGKEHLHNPITQTRLGLVMLQTANNNLRTLNHK